MKHNIKTRMKLWTLIDRGDIIRIFEETPEKAILKFIKDSYGNYEMLDFYQLGAWRWSARFIQHIPNPFNKPSQVHFSHTLNLEIEIEEVKFSWLKAHYPDMTDEEIAII